MRFLRRNQYLLCVAAVLVFSSVMVLRQFMVNQSAHVQMREDFILLQEHGDIKTCERLYQLLIQKLPVLSDNDLVNDLERTAMLVDPKTSESKSLIWKYHVSVKNELQKRSEKRLAEVLEQTQKQ